VRRLEVVVDQRDLGEALGQEPSHTAPTNAVKTGPGTLIAPAKPAAQSVTP
jgi:hypothetical protein